MEKEKKMPCEGVEVPKEHSDAVLCDTQMFPSSCDAPEGEFDYIACGIYIVMVQKAVWVGVDSGTYKRQRSQKRNAIKTFFQLKCANHFISLELRSLTRSQKQVPMRSGCRQIKESGLEGGEMLEAIFTS